MADWNKPDLSSLKSAFPGECRALATNAAKMDFTGDTNIPTGAIAYDTTTKKVKRYNGTTWLDIAPAMSLLATFHTDSLPVSATDHYLFSNGKLGSMTALSGSDLVFTNVTLPVKSYISHMIATRAVNASAVATVTLLSDVTTIATSSFTGTTTRNREDITPYEINSNIVRCKVTQDASGEPSWAITIWGFVGHD